jgi:hypothetical protein
VHLQGYRKCTDATQGLLQYNQTSLQVRPYDTTSGSILALSYWNAYVGAHLQEMIERALAALALGRRGEMLPEGFSFQGSDNRSGEGRSRGCDSTVAPCWFA